MQVVDRGAYPAGEAGQSLSDVEVIRRVRDGETALFELLMRRYNQRLYRVARTILKDDAEAEDVMQQAYINAYTHLDQFAGRALFSTWLTKIAVYEAQARSKRRGTIDRQTAGESGEDTMTKIPTRSPDPEHQAFATELHLLIESAVDGLPEHHRVVFALRDVEGLSTAETAECLGISEDNVKTRLHRARALLRTELFTRTGAVTSGAFRFHRPRCDRVVAGVLERITTVPAPAGRQ